VPVREAGRGSIQRAFNFAVERVSQPTWPTGVFSLYATFVGPFGSDGSSVEAALSIDFLALLNGDPLPQGSHHHRHLESNGSIGQVSQIAEQAMAAAQAGYRMLLVPRGQFYTPRVNRVAFNLKSNVWVREVDTIEEAYAIMTGKKL
jgi:PDZ domain-containing protein